MKSAHLHPQAPPQAVWYQLWKQLDWSYLLLNVVIPIVFILILIFALKSRYRQKQMRLKYRAKIDNNVNWLYG